MASIISGWIRIFVGLKPPKFNNRHVTLFFHQILVKVKGEILYDYDNENVSVNVGLSGAGRVNLSEIIGHELKRACQYETKDVGFFPRIIDRYDMNDEN